MTAKDMVTFDELYQTILPELWPVMPTKADALLWLRTKGAIAWLGGGELYYIRDVIESLIKNIPMSPKEPPQPVAMPALPSLPKGFCPVCWMPTLFNNEASAKTQNAGN